MARTLEAVANAAKVSISTASRALNGHPAISRETATKVKEAAEQLQYQRRRSHKHPDISCCLAEAQIGILSLGMDKSLLTIPAVGLAISGAGAALSDAGATVHLMQSPDAETLRARLRQNSLKGMILLGALQGDLCGAVGNEIVEALKVLPNVWLLGRPEGFSGDIVASDDYQTGVSAAEHLVSCGHQRLAFLNPKPDHLIFMRRESGFTAKSRQLGASVSRYCQSRLGDWQFPLHPPESVEVVQELVDCLLAAKPRPTAIFAAADSVAVLVYRALAVRGIVVGDEISVVSGNNDASLIRGLYPRLTTFDIHPFELGRQAVRQLALRLSYPGDFSDTTTCLSSNLVDGESVKRIGQ